MAAEAESRGLIPPRGPLGGLLAELRALPDGLESRVRADLLLADVLRALGWTDGAMRRLGLTTDEEGGTLAGHRPAA
jgi:hypothetical protein